MAIDNQPSDKSSLMLFNIYSHLLAFTRILNWSSCYNNRPHKTPTRVFAYRVESHLGSWIYSVFGTNLIMYGESEIHAIQCQVGINSQGGPLWDLSIWGILEIHLSGRQLSNWRRQGINRMRWSRSIFLKFPRSRRGRGGQLAAAASSSNALSDSWQEPQEYSNLYCAC